ncbi:MAG TPA: hypothetical protein VLO11_03520 [Luteolibacter sp.]|nr:hypothetical protein [Luteolibacter sp.]
MKSRKTKRAIWLLVLVVVVAFAFLWRKAANHRIEAHLNEARGNLRSMSMALFEFETAYGAYPNNETAKQVIENTETKLPLDDDSSNAIFRQLIASQVSPSEEVFYARIPGAREPDNDLRKPGNVLAKGEVGFSYITGLTSESPNVRWWLRRSCPARTASIPNRSRVKRSFCVFVVFPMGSKSCQSTSAAR